VPEARTGARNPKQQSSEAKPAGRKGTLRIDRFRVFYDIDEGKVVVKIEAIGHKRGNRIYVRGEEFQI